MTIFLSQWYQMTILSKSLSKNLAMNLQGHAHLQHPTFLRCRVEDGDATAEDWTDSDGNSLPADRVWNNASGATIVADDAGPCMGIELNIWERAKVKHNYCNYYNYCRYS